MMNRVLQFWIIVVVLSIGSGCKGKQPANTGGGNTSIHMEYAQQLIVDTCGNYIQVKIRNPWDTAKILHTYLLVDREQKVPAGLPEGTVVKVPLSKALIYSSVHCGLVMELGALNRIGGVCDLQYMRIPDIRERCISGQILDAGNSMNPDLEKIIDLHPDAILLSPFENSGGYGRIEKLGIPIIECADYMETSPLGRAEWMRFFGLLFGCQVEADSMFIALSREYNRLKGMVENTEHRPTVISDLKSGSAWYIPGGKSTTGRLYHDAGAAYIWAEDEHSGSIPLSFETVYDKGQHADFWMIKYNHAQDKTLTGLKADYAPYTGFKAYQTGQVYGCNSGEVPFYEETPFHPELLLRDLIRIFHPEVLEKGKCRYFKKLEK